MQNEMDSTKHFGNGHDSTLPNFKAKPTNMPSSQATGELQGIISDVENLVKKGVSVTGADLAKATTKAGERLIAAGLSVAKMGGSAVDQAKRSATGTNQYVHQQPWKAVGIGAALGLIGGLLLARRD